MAELEAYNVVAGSNQGASPLGMPQGMDPSGVNNSWREHAARHKRWLLDNNGSLNSTGSSNAYALGPNTTSVPFDGMTLSFEANFGNTGAATLNVTPSGGSAHGAKAIVWPDGTALASGDLPSGAKVWVVYDLGNTRWQLTTGSSKTFTLQSTIFNWSDDGAGVGPLIDLKRTSASPAASDIIGTVRYIGKDDGAADQTYAEIRGFIDDPAAASEDGHLEVFTVVGGSFASRVGFGAGIYTKNATGGDKGADTINASAYYRNGVEIGVPRSYLAGLTLSNDAGDTAHDIAIAVGQASDATNSISMALSSILTKRIDATWAAGDDAGGMNDGDVVGNTEWFHVHLLSNAVGSSVDAGFDTSITAAGLLADTAVIAAGLTKYRRIGSVLTDGSANILAFLQVADRFYWAAPPQDIDANTSVTAATVSLTVPPLKVVAIVGGYVDGAAAISIHLYSPDLADTTPAPTTGIVTFGAGANSTGAQAHIQTNSSGQVRWDSDVAGRTFDLATHGWIDRRGRDD